MDFSSLYFITTILVLPLEYRASSASSSAPWPNPEDSGPLMQVHRAHWREKRCSCENLKDKECVYFCHIGIVWVNTPGQVVPYGVGSFPTRLRRELPGRCFCRDRHDTRCLTFCSTPNGRMENTNTSILRKFPTKFKKRYKERNLNAHSRLT